MGEVIAIARKWVVDEAWDAYAKEANRLIANPRLLTDRVFRENLARLDERWRTLFLMSERGK